MSARILIVDDDPDILSSLKQRLEWMGHHTITAKDGAAALSAIQQKTPSLVLLDLELPILSGMDVLNRLNGHGKVTAQHVTATLGEYDEIIPPIIILTAFETIHRAVEAMKLGACDFLTSRSIPTTWES